MNVIDRHMELARINRERELAQWAAGSSESRVVAEHRRRTLVVDDAVVALQGDEWAARGMTTDGDAA